MNQNKETDQFRCQLDIFEGPLDLLLYLVRKNEIDINYLSLTKITSQFVEYMDLMQMLNMDLASEFIVTSATLIHMKTKLLVPDQREEDFDEDPEKEEDLGEDLINKLLMYKQFKEASHSLDERYERTSSTFSRGASKDWLYEEPSSHHQIKDVAIYDLCHAFQNFLKTRKTSQTEKVYAEKFTVEEKMSHIRLLLDLGEEVSFNSIFDGLNNKDETICAFLAILEMIKLQEIKVEQKDRVFGEIIIKKATLKEPLLVGAN